MKLVLHLISFMKFSRNFQTNCYLFVIQGRKKYTVLNRLHIGHSYLTHSFILRREEAPVCVACGADITVKYTLIECANLLEIRKKYFEERSLYLLFRNVIPEIIFDFLRETGVFYKILKCVKEMFV